MTKAEQAALAREISQRAIDTIKTRTLEGRFSRNSSGSRARVYADGTSPVTLRESGAMMDSLRGSTRQSQNTISTDVAVQGARNQKLAHIHNTAGTPSRSGRIRREFLYLTEREWDNVVLASMRAIGLRKFSRGRRGDRF